MTYKESLAFLYGLQKHGIKLGLQKPFEIMSALGNPHHAYRIIHIAGTNGKGSTSAIIASLLRSHGFKVALFTSPHIYSFTERIVVDGKEIAPKEVVSLTHELKDTLRHITAITFFEFVTAMAFVYFKRCDVQWAVIETGLGGRLDATNVVMPEVSVITKIDYDHQEYLGDTLSKIASEKAGIIKPEVPVVSSAQAPEALQVLLDKAGDRLSLYGRDFEGILKTVNLQSITFDYRCKDLHMDNLTLSLAGRHQLQNASIALKAVKKALKTAFKPQVVVQALASVRWQGRLQIIKDSPLTIIDGAHNPNAMLTLRDFINDCLADRHKILILAMMSDKAISEALRILLPLFDEVIFTSIRYERSTEAKELSRIASSLGYSRFSLCIKAADAIDLAYSLATTQSVIVITGSFYLLGEVLEHLGYDCTLRDLSERYVKA